jgi:hypothetical protein
VTHRLDLAGIALLAVAAAAVWVSHGPRDAAARWYAEVAGYNRAITEFVRANRNALRNRDVAVFGVRGLSPWSLSAGAYVNDVVGAPVDWEVYVPEEDIFYRFGRQAGGRVAVRPEADACAPRPQDRRVFLAFDRAGRGAIAARCNEALQHAYPPPVIAAWGPKSVTREQAASGFDMYFTGSNLVDGVDVAVAGAALGVMRVEQGRVMTTRIPAGTAADGLVRFTVRHRGRPVLEEAVDVSDAERHSR